MYVCMLNKFQINIYSVYVIQALIIQRDSFTTVGSKFMTKIYLLLEKLKLGPSFAHHANIHLGLSKWYLN